MELKILYIFILLSLICSSAGYSNINFDMIENFTEKYIQENKIAGLGLGITIYGNTIYSKGFGFQNLEKSIKIHENFTLFRWASLSKIITSVISFKLRNEGIIDFNLPIKQYLHNFTYNYPKNYSINCNNSSSIVLENITYECTENYVFINIPEDKDFINIGQILSHRAGILDYDNGVKSPVPPQELINNPKSNLGIEWSADYYKDLPLISIPGTNYNYTTFGYNLLGIILSQAAENSYEKLFEKYVQNPLSLYSLVPDRHWENSLYPNRCIGYNNLTITGDNDISYKLPGGGFISTLNDCIDFFKNVFFTEKLMTLEDKKEAFQNLNNSDYGLGIQIFNKTGHKYGIGHTGSQEKTKNIVKFYPDDEIMIVAMSNSENFDNYDFIHKLEKLIFSSDKFFSEYY